MERHQETRLPVTEDKLVRYRRKLGSDKMQCKYVPCVFSEFIPVNDVGVVRVGRGLFVGWVRGMVRGREGEKERRKEGELA